MLRRESGSGISRMIKIFISGGRASKDFESEDAILLAFKAGMTRPGVTAWDTAFLFNSR